MTTKKRSFTDMNQGNALATLLDERREAWDALQEAKYRVHDTERAIMHKILKDPIGFEDCITINYRKLERLFGG